jgi:hypothetical protein
MQDILIQFTFGLPAIVLSLAILTGRADCQKATFTGHWRVILHRAGLLSWRRAAYPDLNRTAAFVRRGLRSPQAENPLGLDFAHPAKFVGPFHGFLICVRFLEE